MADSEVERMLELKRARRLTIIAVIVASTAALAGSVQAYVSWENRNVQLQAAILSQLITRCATALTDADVASEAGDLFVQAIENNKDHAEQYGAKFVDSFETYHRSLLELRLLLSSNYASAAASLRKEQGDVAKGTLSLSADEQRLERMKFLAKGIGRLKEKIEAQCIEISRL